MQLVAGVIGAAIGAPFGMASLGWAIGSAIGGAFASSSAPDIVGPRLSELSAPQLEYGWEIPRLYGTDLHVPWCCWQSDLIEVQTESTQGGKGGGGQTVITSAYFSNNIYVVGEMNETAELLRVWFDKKLVATFRADSPGESIVATGESPAFASITLRTGDPDQDPWPVYEADVGTGEAAAQIGVITVCIEMLAHHGGGTKPAVEVEVTTSALGEGGNVFLQMNFDGAVASTTMLDESCYNWTITNANLSQQASAKFGATASANVLLDKDAETSLATAGGVAWTADEHLTMQGWFYIGYDTDRPITLLEADGGGLIRLFINDAVSPDRKSLGVLLFGDEAAYGPEYDAGAGYPVPLGEWFHAALDYHGPTHTVSGYINGAQIVQFVYSGTPPITASIGGYRVLNVQSLHTGADIPAGTFAVDGVQMIRRVRLFPDPFTPPASAPSGGGCVFDPQPIEHNDVLEAELVRAGIPIGVIDLSETVGIPLLGYTARGPARRACEALSSIAYYDFAHEGTLQTVLRGGASQATIPYTDLGVSVDTADENAFDLTIASDIEVPRKFALTVRNYDDDYNNLTVKDDRIVSSSAEEKAITVGVVMQPPNAQGVVNTMAADSRIASDGVQISLSDYYVQLQLARPHLVYDHDGTLHRLRFVRETYEQGVRKIECVRDDQTVLQTTGTTKDDFEPNLTITRPPTATAEATLLDIPILDDSANSPGVYAAVYWTGAATTVPLYRSVDGATFSLVGTVANSATVGTVSALTSTSRGWIWEADQSVTVTLRDSTKTLSSSTRTAMEADSSINVAAIGVNGRWEIVRFRSAALLSPGVYLLSDMLRGNLGTEWAITTHAAGDAFVLLSGAGILRLSYAASEIAQTRYFKAGSLAAGAQTFVDTGIGLKPYAPVDLRNTGTDIEWHRRSRLSSSYLPGTLVTLGEATESYDAEFLDGGDVVLSTATATSETTPVSTGVKVIVYQNSAVVGRGYPAELEL